MAKRSRPPWQSLSRDQALSSWGQLSKNPFMALTWWQIIQPDGRGVEFCSGNVENYPGRLRAELAKEDAQSKDGTLAIWSVFLVFFSKVFAGDLLKSQSASNKAWSARQEQGGHLGADLQKEIELRFSPSAVSYPRCPSGGSRPRRRAARSMWWRWSWLWQEW